MQNWGRYNGVFFDESPDSFGSLDFVRGHARHGDGWVAVVGLDVANGLGAVREEGDAFFRADFRKGVDVLDEAGLIVDVHDASEDGVGTEGCAEFFVGDAPVMVDIEVGYIDAEGFEVGASVEDGFVLGLDGDDVVAFVAIGLPIPLDGEVDRLSGTGGEDDFFRADVDVVGNALPCVVNGLFCDLTVNMLAVRIAEVLRKVGKHGL